MGVNNIPNGGEGGQFKVGVDGEGPHWGSEGTKTRPGMTHSFMPGLVLFGHLSSSSSSCRDAEPADLCVVPTPPSHRPSLVLSAAT